MARQLYLSPGHVNLCHWPLFIDEIGIGYWQSANAWSAIANHDNWAGTIAYEAYIVNSLHVVFKLYSDYDQYQYNDDALYVRQ